MKKIPEGILEGHIMKIFISIIFALFCGCQLNVQPLNAFEIGTNFEAKKELVVVSSNVPDKEKIGTTLKSYQDILFLQEGNDPFVQMLNYLKEYQNISFTTLHIISYGDKGRIIFDEKVINTENFNVQEWQGISAYLSPEANILLYGCNIAGNTEGKVLISQIAKATNRGIAASTDLTGFGGNWELEYSLGKITSDHITIDNYSYHLGPNSIFVDQNATGLNNGTSWANAYISLANALNIAYTQPIIDTVFVAAGKYLPAFHPDITSATPALSNRDFTFSTPISGLVIMGGYPTGGGVRDFVANQTILSGDIGVAGDASDNAYHVLSCYGEDNSVVIDGVIIEDGNANDNGRFIVPNGIFLSLYSSNGGGIVDLQGSARIVNTIVRNNTATINGGGFYYYIGANSSFENVTLYNNKAGTGGAAYYSTGNSISYKNVNMHDNSATLGGGAYIGGIAQFITIDSSQIYQNKATGGNGGGMFMTNNVSTQITNTSFSANTASQSGGGIYNISPSTNTNEFELINSYVVGNSADAWGGGIYDQSTRNIHLTNVVVGGNTSGITGGGLYYADNIGTNPSAVILTNVTIATNTTANSGGAITNKDSNIEINNSIITSNKEPELYVYLNGTMTYHNSLVRGGTLDTSNGNILGTTDPVFENPALGNYRLSTCSPLIDKGNNTYIAGYTRDLDNRPRIYHNTVDLGAYELQGLSADTTIVWTGAAGDNDWHNAANWIVSAVPQYCSDVYIPGNVDYFPTLSDITTNQCDNIYFMQGGEIAQPQNLTYNKAHIQYNFGLENPAQPQQTSTDFTNHLEFSAGKTESVLTRSKWHMLSAPLHSMVSGDFSFGSYPLTFMRKFDATAPSSGTYPIGEWTGLYASFSEELAPAEGFILWMNRWQEANRYREYNQSTDNQGFPNREYGLQQVNGIIELPYYEDANMTRAHRTHRTIGTTNTFNYVNDDPGDTDFMQVLSDQDTYDRGTNNKAYRFIAETFNGGSNSWEFQDVITYTNTNNNQASEVLIGNPFMSTIDFVQFANDNPSIQPQYRLWTGDSFSTLAIVGGNPISTGAVALDQYIAPMQSFFVLTNPNAGNYNINFDVANISVPKPPTSTSQLRNEGDTNIEQNIIRVKARNEASYISETLIGKLSSANDFYDRNEDVYKLFSQKGDVPEIFSIVDNYALEMNFVKSNDLMIPLGLKTNKLGKTTFTISGMDNYDASLIEFVDKTTGQTIDITGKKSFDYVFDNTVTGIQNNRFYISIDGVTSIDNTLSEANEQVYFSNNGIAVVSSVSNPIKQIMIYDIHGRLLYNRNGINASLFEVEDQLNSDVIIVKVVSEKGVKSVKLINNNK